MIKKVRVDAKQIDRFKAEIKAGNHTFLLDQALPIGEDTGPTPMELLFSSLAGCIIGTAHIIAVQRQLKIEKLAVKVEGEMNTDVINGKNNEDRAGFDHIQITLEVDADISSEEREVFLSEIRRRCPVSDNVEHITSVEFRLM
jgi:putative redox protein